MIPGLVVVFLHPARIVIRSVVGPDRVIVNVQELSAPVTDLAYPCYRGNFLHHRHLFFALVHVIQIFHSCIFMDYTIRRSASPEFPLAGSRDQDHRLTAFAAEDLSHGFLHGLSLMPDYIEKTGDSQLVRQSNDCRTSDTIACVGTIRPCPGCERSEILNCKVDLLHFFIAHRILPLTKFQMPFTIPAFFSNRESPDRRDDNR